MSDLAYSITHGITSELRQRGVREITYSRTGVDRVEDAWRMPAADTLQEGDAHPVLTGCIVEEMRVTGPFGESGRQIWDAEVTAFGDARGTKPTKTLNRGKRRTLDVGFDERTVRYLSWHADWKACTGVAATDVITCTAHGFSDGDRVVFARLTGGAGITGQSSSSLGGVYYVRDKTTDTFKVSATLGGSAVDITTTLSAGEVIAAEFALGVTHPSYPYMYLCEANVSDENQDWKTVDCIYRGLEEDKPYKRIVTCNGQSMSSSNPIYWDFPDGSETLLNRSVNLPQVQVTDIYLTTSALATSSVPLSQSEGGTPPNPPAIRTVVIDDDDDNLVYQWPAYWSIMGVSHQEVINNLIGVQIQAITYEYRWPVLLK